MLIGKIEKVVPSEVHGWMRVSGWLAQASGSDGPIKADLFVNGVLARVLSTDRPVRPRFAASLPAGARQFSVSVPIRWNRPGRNDFAIGLEQQIQPSVEGLSIELDPRLAPPDKTAAPAHMSSTSTAAPEPRAIRGRIQRIEAGILHGWLWRPADPEPVRFMLLANEREVGEFVADQRRADLVRRGIGNGHHAFRIRLRREWLDERTTFTVRILPERERLPDALVLDRPDAAPEDEPKSAVPQPRERVRALSTPPQPVPAALVPDKVLQAMQLWSTTDLVDFFTRFEDEVLLERGKKLMKEKKWSELGSFLPTSLQSRRRRVEFNIFVGRGLIYEGKPGDAAQVLTGAARVAPTNGAAQFYAAVACARAGRHEDAVGFGRAAVQLVPDSKQYLMDHGANCRRLAATLKDGDQAARRAALEESIEIYTRAMEINGDKLDLCLLQLARSQVELDRYDESIATLRRLQEHAPDNVEGLMLLSQSLVAANRVKEALVVAERVVELDPLRQGPRFQLRTLKSLVTDDDPRPAVFGVARWNRGQEVIAVNVFAEADGAVTAEPLAEVEFSSNPVMALASLRLDWVLLAPEGWAPLPDAGVLRRLSAAAVSWPGRLVMEHEGVNWTFWRRDLLVALAEARIVTSIGELIADLQPIESVVATAFVGEKSYRSIDLLAAPCKLDSGPVIVMSRHGAVKFGGGEHFIASMAQHYRRMGHDPIIVGTRPERIGEEGEADGVRTAFVEASPAALRRYFLAIKPRFVHVLSGLGYEVAEALDYTNIPFVYGIHYWRDCLGLAENDTRFFANHDREPIARPTFRHIIESAATVYSNSEFTREVLQEAFGVRTPVIYSLPEDVEDKHPGSEVEASEILGDVRNYVLLVNAKSDKGFDLLVEVAKRLPHVPFLVIASQSDSHEAHDAVAKAGLANMHIIGHTARMDIVYSRARVVTVPSYAFIETFSRVCIEAQRYGKPVIGSTIGNVPYLLKNSGIVLPEQSEDWTREIGRLYADENYYRERCAMAVENGLAYGHDLQRKAIEGVIASLPRSILIGVGSGIGNMLHVGPMIRNIARRLGRKVDLVMTEDHKSGHFILQHDEYVNTVYSLGPEVMRRRYDTVFITHSFGKARLPFQGRHVLYARDWENFEPGGPYHETVYNLESARVLLGIPYDEDDVKGYYIGNFTYSPPAVATLRVGFHGGSKDGFWRSKRWPHYETLARRLQERGYEVMSFGIPEEYVPGTIDRTGGSIAEMTDALRGLHYLVSNDSGVMNIANALGLPVMALFGPTNPATRGPLGAKSRWVALAKDCAPCEVSKVGQATFLAGNCRCIEELPLEMVERAILSHMGDLGLIGPAGSESPPLAVTGSLAAGAGTET